MKNHRNFSFDVGMTSLGIAVNENDKIIHADVLLMHPEAGSVKAQAERRRQYRTREAHKEREKALEQLWRDIGEKPLQRKSFKKEKNAKGRRKFIKTKADERLEREFPGKGDDTVYTSCLLRIMLLEGKPLEVWQIYKALNAGIQRRGYDSNVPWKTREEAREKEKESTTGKDENPEKQAGEFQEKLTQMTPDTRYHLPCYYDAWKMGLWDNQTQKIIHIRQPRRSAKEGEDKVRGYNPSRDLVTSEICRLLEQAAKQIPKLQSHLTGEKLEILYGKQENAIDERYPSALKIDGLLGQKYPRFENRIVSKCALIPRLNVCKAEKQLAIEVGFLMRLVNWRYEKEDAQGNKSVHPLSGQEIAEKFNECKAAWQKKEETYHAENYAKCFKLTKKPVAQMAEKLGGSVKAEHEEIPAGKHTGRSRFSQPALYLMKSLIFSGKTPQDFYEELLSLVATQEKENPGAEFGYTLFPDVPYKYFSDDFKFLEKMGNTRDKIYVPDMSLAERYLNENGDVESAIQRVINSCNWPELRHRLNVFLIELEKLTKKYGKPDAVHLEFIREDFLSEKKKKKYTAQADTGKKARQNAVEALKENNITVNDKNILRYRLFEEQNKQCLYTGGAIDISELENCDIDHIFPRGSGGPDAYYNKVLTSADTNRKQKGDRLPCECEFINWKAFNTRLKNLSLGKNKKKILLASNRKEVEELVEKYTGLSGTAHIARLARDIACLKFGWQPGAKDELQRVFTFSGGLTSKIAKKYELYKALGDGSKEYQKDRSDHRHHALDAMVISYLHQWARDKNKTNFFKFPGGIDAEYFAEKLDEVYPRHITKTRPAIAEQPKGKNEINVKEFRNISKDPDERGQWYTNKSETGKGTSQHGYIFYKDDKGKVCSKTVHSFRSLYQAQKEMEKKLREKGGVILGLFYSGQSIYLPNQDKTATQLGRDARLPFGNYRVARINKKDIIIEFIPKQEDDSVGCYRITNPDDLKKIVITNQLMTGDSFELDGFLVKKKSDPLSGRYRADTERSDYRYFTIVNVQGGEEEFIQSDGLVRHLVKQSEVVPKEDDTVRINKDHRNYISKVKTDDIAAQILPEEHYQIKGFGSGAKKVNLISQNGTVYQINSKILAYAKKLD